LAAAVGGRALFVLDAETPVPVVEIALLRSLPLFAELPAPAIEGLAAALTPIHLAPGAVLIRQGGRGTLTMRSPRVNSTSCTTGISCAGADEAKEWARSPCCATSRARRP